MTPSYTYTLHFHGQPLVLAVWGTRLLVHTASVEAIIGSTISFEPGSFEDTYFAGRYFPVFHAGAFVYTYPIGRQLFTWLSNIRVHGSQLILPNGHKLPMPAAPFSPLPRWQQIPKPIYPLQPVSLKNHTLNHRKTFTSSHPSPSRSLSEVEAGEGTRRFDASMRSQLVIN